MRTIAIVTSGRADWSPLRPVAQAIVDDPALDIRIIACGTHLSETFGHTIDNILADGFEVAETVPTVVDADTAEAVTASMARAVEGLGIAYGALKPDLLLLLGDRYETLAAAAASLPHAIPIAHLHGGEVTRGAFDDAIRHAVTKMSHLHFPATVTSAKRIVRMGEAPERVFVSGAPGLDNLNDIEPMKRNALEAVIGLPLDPAPLLATYHATTLAPEDVRPHHVEALLDALEQSAFPVIFTHPNADSGSMAVANAIHERLKDNAHWRMVKNLGTPAYFSLMRQAAAMVGNSSSGIIEAASFGLPVVDIGLRQDGRERGANVIWSEEDSEAILAAIHKATTPAFHEACATMTNIYGDGAAASKIVKVLREHPLDGLLMKGFHD